ncbi:MAG TPA: DUF6790 family protein [Bryobacteraceae bacterium]|jgi:hypothetical protein
MYFAVVALLLFVLPVACLTGEASFAAHPMSMIALTGKWFVFWAVGVRLFIAGVRQVAQPRFTAEEIFAIHDPASFAIVREIGFANLSIGLLGLLTIVRHDWTVAAAIVGGLYYGLAGLGHAFRPGKNAKEYTAMISDEFVFLVLSVFVWSSLA